MLGLTTGKTTTSNTNDTRAIADEIMTAVITKARQRRAHELAALLKSAATGGAIHGDKCADLLTLGTTLGFTTNDLTDRLDTLLLWRAADAKERARIEKHMADDVILGSFVRERQRERSTEQDRIRAEQVEKDHMARIQREQAARESMVTS